MAVNAAGIGIGQVNWIIIVGYRPELEPVLLSAGQSDVHQITGAESVSLTARAGTGSRGSVQIGRARSIQFPTVPEISQNIRLLRIVDATNGDGLATGHIDLQV